MKVALELQPCLRNRSGIGTYTYEIARRVFDTETTQFCGNLFNFNKKEKGGIALKGIKIPIRECETLPYSIYRRIWHMFPIPYNKIFPQADVNIFFDYIVPPRISGHVISVIYDLTYLRFPETMSKRNRSRIENDIKYSIDRSDKIITITEFSKSELISLLGIPSEKIKIVSPAPSLALDAEDYKDLSHRYNITKPFLLYVGTIEPRKNLSRLMQAFEWLKSKKDMPHQLVLAGGLGWKNKEIQDAILQSPYKKDIIMTGYIADKEKNALYQAADLFVFPSIYEGFGIPPLEAMTFGCPVVCSNAASLPEVVGDAAELVDPMDVDSIAEGMWKVLSDDFCRAELVKKGYKQAKKFNWDDSAKKLMQICREVLEEM